jgi:hypothetical protein
MVSELTKLPASLDEGDLRVVHEERDSPEEEVRVRLEVGVEHGDVFAVCHVVVLQSFLERAGLVPLPVPPDLVLYVHAFALPPLALRLHQVLQTGGGWRGRAETDSGLWIAHGTISWHGIVLTGGGHTGRSCPRVFQNNNAIHTKGMFGYTNLEGD